AALTLFVLPVGGQTFLGNIVHLPGTNLHFYFTTLLGDNGGMQRLIAVGLGHRYKISDPFGNGRIPISDNGIYPPAVFFTVGIFKDNTNSKKIVILCKRFLLALHLPEDGVDMLRASLYLEGKALRLQLLVDRLHEFVDKLLTRFSFLTQFPGNKLERVRIYHLKAEVFQLTLHIKQAKTVCQRSI